MFLRDNWANYFLRFYKKNLFELKSLYQTVNIFISIWYFRQFNHSVKQDFFVKSKLQKRFFKWEVERKIKIFIILSLNNWENILINELSVLGPSYIFTWNNVSNFFKIQEDWKLFFQKLNIRLREEFDNFYNDHDNFIIFYYASDFSISVESVKYLNRKNTISISFCWDDILYFRSIVNNQPVGIYNLSKAVDYNYTFSPEVIPRYNYNKSACYFWKSLPIQTNLNNDLIDVLNSNNYSDNFFVLFVGTKYGWREDFINQLISSGINVICYGKGWENGELSQFDLQQQILHAPITLGFSAVGYTKKITTLKGRDFEVPLWGGLYLTQFSKGLQEYYEIGKEILTYSSIKECIEQIKIIQNNPTLALSIRIAGYNKALISSSWKSRVLFLKNHLSKLIDFYNN